MYYRTISNSKESRSNANAAPEASRARASLTSSRFSRARLARTKITTTTTKPEPCATSRPRYTPGDAMKRRTERRATRSTPFDAVQRRRSTPFSGRETLFLYPFPYPAHDIRSRTTYSRESGAIRVQTRNAPSPSRRARRVSPSSPPDVFRVATKISLGAPATKAVTRSTKKRIRKDTLSKDFTRLWRVCRRHGRSRPRSTSPRSRLCGIRPASRSKTPRRRFSAPTSRT